MRVSEARAGLDMLGGTFQLGFGGALTSTIAYDASASVLEAALEALPTVGDVEVTHIRLRNGNSWEVTFTSLGVPENLGDLPLLSAHDSMTTGTSVGLRVRELAAGCCALEVRA